MLKIDVVSDEHQFVRYNHYFIHPFRGLKFKKK